MFVFGSLKIFLLPVPGLPAVPIHFRILLPFIFAPFCRLSSVCCLSSPLLRVVGRQHCVLAMLSVEYELRLWKKRTLRAFMLFFSFVGMDSLAVLLASLVVTGDFFRLSIDSLAYRILVFPSWQIFFQYAMMLVYNVLRCILFVSAFERDSGQTAGQTGGSSVEAYWCGRERCLELIG